LLASSPKLIAGSYALHRLLTPRHPPCALDYLTTRSLELWPRDPREEIPRRDSPNLRWTKSTQRLPSCLYIFSESEPPARAEAHDQRSLKDRQQHLAIHQPTGRTRRSGPSCGSLKEVIQPQVPLRLPCYDFTPIIDQTVGGSLPCGLGYRLWVEPTFVV
jgi:hypothetical protein